MNNDATVRVRFAPSPTGLLHIGGARTAIYNWLYARNQDGVFIIRIEDTDQERSSRKSTENILKHLQWLGLDWDEGPVFQSKRKSLYRTQVEKLFDMGSAEYCDGSKTAVVLHVPQGKTIVRDVLRGDVAFDNSEFSEIIIMKSDGTPTYNFACAVDDHEMAISHVFRGDDHLSNTPKQLAIGKALGFQAPKYIHLPLIVNEARSVLSKRYGAVSVEAFKKEGILPEALLNYLSLLGWSPGGNQEIMSQAEMIKKFKVKAIGKSSAVFDMKKLEWINAHYVKTCSLDQLTNIIIPEWIKLGYVDPPYDKGHLLKVIGLIRERLKTMKDLPRSSDYFFIDEPQYDIASCQKIVFNREIEGFIECVSDALVSIVPFHAKEIELSARALINKYDSTKSRDFLQALRVVLTGKSVSPSIFLVMEILGPERCQRNLTYGLQFIKSFQTKANDGEQRR
ncbi:glutamate--tRNA ligase [PVC group bacterium]|nr:glutamate--tRNA ligase [PVC group bacterium]